MRACERPDAERSHRQLRRAPGDAHGWARRVRRRVEARGLLRTEQPVLEQDAFVRQCLQGVAEAAGMRSAAERAHAVDTRAYSSGESTFAWRSSSRRCRACMN